ncbi:acetyl-CoA carboxylase biotin carboxyl carrier protein [Streptosporangium sp. CA-135522]|uniref:acetyl-CoA carboxylase biotin carboxyl carrier protein n=1 Tax=Streptosporangium sp. CA-135522 TaxID=3240072 RepID=UPI003D915A7E
MSTPPQDTSLLVELWQRAAQLIDTGSGQVRRIKLTAGDASVEVEWPEAAPAHPAAPAPAGVAAGVAVEVATPEAAETDEYRLRAPLVGTFYRAPAPGAKPFVEVGDTVVKGQRVAILEAMKLMNGLEADRDGLVTAILVEDGARVEYDQPLITICPPDQ